MTGDSDQGDKNDVERKVSIDSEDVMTFKTNKKTISPQKPLVVSQVKEIST